MGKIHVNTCENGYLLIRSFKNVQMCFKEVFKRSCHDLSIFHKL